MIFDFQFKTHWNSDEKILKSIGEELAKALMATGKTEKEAADMVNQFQQESFLQGELEESYNNEDFS